MVPALAPLPTPWNLPFQPATGIHTSNRTAGLLTAATRQNAGKSFSVEPSRASGGVNDGPEMVSAAVMVVSARAIEAIRSQVLPAGGELPCAASDAASATASSVATGNRIMMRRALP